MRRRRLAGRRARHDRQGVCGPQTGQRVWGGYRAPAAGLREKSDRALQVSPRDRVHRHAAAHRDRQGAALQAEENIMMQTLQPPSWAKPRGFANGIAASGKLVFIAGQVGWTGEGKWEARDFAGQFKQTIRNILSVLAEANGKPEHIVRLTWYVLDKKEYLDSLRQAGRAYAELLGRYYPTMGVGRGGGLF